LLSVVEVRADEGVAAFDVGTEVGEGAVFVEDLKLMFDGGAVGVFEDFEAEGEFRYFDGLGVDIDAVNVVEQDALALGDGEVVGGGSC
jgi:hypothetical protein